ncbi:Mannosyltransferase OCH1 [Hartmannibacter diazotrophicus]|uniref:Mannosyltransferase OCH1 n=1 Tax=Hartmannibacter diazotrophicus TaxID=1482074 RepID=A0A2C9DB25_9HYPH|nr:glycosyltransferase [Hartmannibacter diazotrophicus]SON57379.1 Mannosyltransferase OCH1 [Hartmannibacter diazotrophicus]
MTDRGDLRSQLKQAIALIETGRIREAEDCLEAIAGKPDDGSLGPMTALGMPRKLHAARLKLAKRAEGRHLDRVGLQATLVPDPAILAPHGHFSVEERQRAAAAAREPVPRVLHQIWIGDAPPPPSTDAWARHARRHGYDYRLWREDDLASIGASEHPIFQQRLAEGDFPGAVDVARYLVLETEGGIYLDCDWYPASDRFSFHDLMPLIGLVALSEDIPRLTHAGSLLLANSFIAVPPAHPAMTKLLGVLETVDEALKGAPAWWSTGPLIFTVVCRAGPVTLASPDLVAGSVARKTSLSEVEAWCERLPPDGAGLLLAWKSW